MKHWLPFFSNVIARHWPLVLTLAVFLLHGLGFYRLPYTERLDAWIYDARIVAHAPRTLDPNVAIVDVDEASLSAIGRWPWPRSKIADLITRLTDEQQAAAVGFDMVFAEPDTPQNDAALAAALRQKPVVLGYYLTSDRAAHTSGMLPAPLMTRQSLGGRDFQVTAWSGFGANLPALSAAAPQAGFINAISDDDGVIRSAPLVAEYQGQYYESLALGLFRRYRAVEGILPAISPHYAQASAKLDYPYLDGLRLQRAQAAETIAVDSKVAMLVPYRGRGGANAGSFTYISAKDVLQGKLAPASLKGKVVIFGSSAPTLEDLRVTPMGNTYPGVEVQANLVAGLIAGQTAVQPDYARAFELFQLLVLSLLLLILFTRLQPAGAVVVTLMVCVALWWLHRTLHFEMCLVLPVASALALCLVAFVVHASYGFFLEGQRRKHLVRLFGSYVSPHWVSRMVRSQNDYSMQASNQNLTVMFCDMRGFSRLAETLQPLALQALLNDIFNRLSDVIQLHGGTIDKYMGDCVMAFWGAPEPQFDHAARAVRCALQMQRAIMQFNAEAEATTPLLQMGIGIHTGLMCVGDMGSNIRRSYTVIGNAVNIAARLQDLCKPYNRSLLLSDAVRLAAQAQQLATDAWAWQDLGDAAIEGNDHPVHIYTL
jgi:adenylate cyclase